MKTMGIDVGNILSKVVILEDDKPIATGVIETTGNVSDEMVGLVEKVLADAGMTREQLYATAGTGSGADLLTGVDFVEDEVTCVGTSTGYLLHEIDLAVEIGGQSITSIELDEEGDVVNFMRNDKCASGSGRFLEVISGALGVGIEGIDEVVAQAGSPVSISSQCGVFGESEVITHVNAGEELADIVAGVCESVANIVVAQIRRFGTLNVYTLTGGVVRVDSVARTIREKLDGKYFEFPYDPCLAAAIGAAMLAGVDLELSS